MTTAPQAKQAQRTPTPFHITTDGGYYWLVDGDGTVMQADIFAEPKLRSIAAKLNSHDALVAALREIADPRSPKGTAQMRNIAQAALHKAEA